VLGDDIVHQVFSCTWQDEAREPADNNQEQTDKNDFPSWPDDRFEHMADGDFGFFH
jgi:hypothetical protein